MYELAGHITDSIRLTGPNDDDSVLSLRNSADGDRLTLTSFQAARGHCIITGGEKGLEHPTEQYSQRPIHRPNSK